MGVADGCADGTAVGEVEGAKVGDIDGPFVGVWVGMGDGCIDGTADGETDGAAVGDPVHASHIPGHSSDILIDPACVPVCITRPQSDDGWVRRSSQIKGSRIP